MRKSKYPSQTAQNNKEEELYQSYYKCPGSVKEELSEMSDEDALALANTMNEETRSKLLDQVLRGYFRQFVEHDIVEWLNNCADEMTYREEMENDDRRGARRDEVSMFHKDQAA